MQLLAVIERNGEGLIQRLLFCTERRSMIWGEEIFMTTRTSRAVRTGLRRIIADPKASLGLRMKAIQLLIAVEGVPSVATNKSLEVKSSANQRKFRGLLAEMQKETVAGSPGEVALPKHHASRDER